MAFANGDTQLEAKTSGQINYTLAFILVTCLFLLWGTAYGLLDVLNKHFQETLNITKTRSTLLQAAYFGAYFIVALPAGLFMNRFGYKRGIILGLCLYATGAILFYPSAGYASFNFFLLAVFILASGLTCLETAANPYVTILGKPETAEFRLNLAQCFNGVGSFLGPIIGANLFFVKSGNLDSVKLVYVVIASVVLVIAGIFFRTPLPEITSSISSGTQSGINKPLFSHSHFIGAIAAQFFYVAAQVGVAALFINYCTESHLSLNSKNASYLLSIAMILFTVGRFVGTALMRKIAANKLLAVYAIFNIVLCALVIANKGWLSIYALIAVFFFESIMFPTIFALGIKNLGNHTKKASSFIIMAIVGGALVPYFMGLLADRFSTATAYLIPLGCFACVAWYGWKGSQTNC